MFHIILGISLLVLAIWLALIFGHGRFWQIERDPAPPDLSAWPEITVIIPARNEAKLIGETLRSLWRQGYPCLKIVLVDDRSDDGTAEVAEAAARQLGNDTHLQVIHGAPVPPGWAGKVWAMHQGLEAAKAYGSQYILFCDADVSHGPRSLKELVSRAESGPYDLVSFMVKLRCETAAEKLMIPAFVFFFRMLYPFCRVNNADDRLAGAAGGTMLVRSEALERIGGLTCIKSELIDDCSLAREIKRGGHRIWIGLSDSSISTRGYGGLREIIRMISRTAYTQLGYSPFRLLGCIAGLALTFLVPPVLTVAARGTASLISSCTWLLMCTAYLPMLRFYRRSPLWAPLLPLIATIYLWATIRSAWRYHTRAKSEWRS